MYRTINDNLMKQKLMDLMHADLATAYNMTGSQQEVFLRYATMENKPKLDWRAYDKEIDPARKCARPFTYKLFVDVIRVHLLPGWTSEELQQVDAAVLGKIEESKDLICSLGQQEQLQARQRIMEEVERELNLKNRGKPFKPVQDRMRNVFTRRVAARETFVDDVRQMAEMTQEPTQVDDGEVLKMIRAILSGNQ